MKRSFTLLQGYCKFQIKKPPTASAIKKYFNLSTCSIQKKLSCTLCTADLTYTGGMSNMLNHLHRKRLSEGGICKTDKADKQTINESVNSTWKTSPAETE